MDEGPYFFNSAGLYLKDWVARFNPDKEDLTWAPVWIQMYSLPDEYWEERLLKEIGNGLGEYIKAAEETKLQRHTSYARICVFMRLDQPLPDMVSLAHHDNEWIQPLDYEHVPFRCRKCHAHGHLFRDCPLNAMNKTAEPFNPPSQDGFTKAPSQKRLHKKPQTGKKPLHNAAGIPSTSNNFEILNQDSDSLDPNQKLSQPPSNDQPNSAPPDLSHKAQPQQDSETRPDVSHEKLQEKTQNMEVDDTIDQSQSMDPSTAEGSQV